MPTLFLCENCEHLKAIYLARYPKDFRITIMCEHYYTTNIRPKINKMCKK